MPRKIGYKSPPQNTQFQKGQSGNPSGRPKRLASVLDDFLAELREMITITEGGRAKQITKQRALVKAMTAAGIKGNAKSADVVLKAAARLAEAQTEAGAQGETTAADLKIVDDYIERRVQERLVQERLQLRKEGE